MISKVVAMKHLFSGEIYPLHCNETGLSDANSFRLHSCNFPHNELYCVESNLKKSKLLDKIHCFSWLNFI